jgi:hypothetical protein
MGAVHDSLAQRLVAGIAALDEEAIAACFAADATFRALIPPGLRERTGAAPTASLIASWFRDSTELDLVDQRAGEVGDRMQIWYRFVGVEEGQPYIVEQHLSCLVGDGKIQRADLLCSGFRPRGRDVHEVTTREGTLGS